MGDTVGDGVGGIEPGRARFRGGVNSRSLSLEISISSVTGEGGG